MNPSNKLTRTLLIFLPTLLLSTTAIQAQQLEQAVEELANEISQSLIETDKKKIAILPFTNLAGDRTKLGQLMAEELINQLFTLKAGRFDVVERTKVEAIWTEQELGAGGWLTAEALGGAAKLTGADTLLTGSIAELSDRIRVNARMIAVPSGQLFATASAFMLKTSLGKDVMAPIRSKGENTTTSARRTKTKSRSVKNVNFDLLKCEKQTRLIICHLVAVNNDVDRELRIFSSNTNTSLYDQAGKVFYSNLAKIANQESTGPHIRLITEVPTSIEVHFQGVPSTIEFIKVLSIRTSFGQVEFRDVHF